MNYAEYNYHAYENQKGRVRIKTLVLFLLLIGVLSIPGYFKLYPFVKNYIEEKSRDQAAEDVDTTYEKPVLESVSVTSVKAASIPSSARVAASFTPQAPNRDWNDASGYGMACEEAALLMNHYYLQGKKFKDGKIPRDIAIREIDKMLSYQKKHYGYSRGEHKSDLNMTRLGKFAKDYYGYDYKVIENLSKADIKRELAAGNMVIVPVMTKPLRDLGRGHYSAGNVYHVFPLIGYKSSGVIANDNGFTQGKNWFYTWDVLFKAVDSQTTNKPKRSALVLIDSE